MPVDSLGLPSSGPEPPRPSLRPVGETAWLLSEADPRRLVEAFEQLAGAGLPEVRDLVLAAESLLVILDDGASLGPEKLAAALSGTGPHANAAARAAVEIPTRYGGLDLARVAAHTGLTEEEVVRRHAGAEYTVGFVGFQPGFPYIRGLPPELATPRLLSPRPRVPAGSVAIGGVWAGIYPASTPGGWNLIGTTRLGLFDAGREVPALLQPGDRVRFIPVLGEP